MRALKWLAVVLGLACAAGPALAQSTINTSVPAAGGPVQALPVQQNFLKAASDINGILGMHPASSVGGCPSTTLTGVDCLVTGTPPNLLWYKSNGVGGYSLFQTFNTSTGTFTPATPVAGAVVTAAAVAPIGGLPLYAAPTATGSGNCLSSGNACTLPTACSFIRSIATFLGAAGPINLLDGSGGSYSTLTNGVPICEIDGDLGGSTSQIVTIIGDTLTPSNVVIAPTNNNIGFLIQDHATASVTYLEAAGGGSNSIDIQCRQQAICDYGFITWAGAGIHVAVAPNANANCSGSETILTTFTEHWDVESGSSFSGGCATSFPNAITWNQLIAGNSANVNLGGWTWTAVGGLVGGPGFSGIGPGRLILPASASCASQMPGSGAGCQFTQGYQDSFGEGFTGAGIVVGQQSPSIQTPTLVDAIVGAHTYAGLPGSPTAGQISHILDGLAANCSDGACTTPNAIVTLGGGALDLLINWDGAAWRIFRAQAVPALANLSGILGANKGGTGVATANANTIFAGPNTGSAAQPSFRVLVGADLPLPGSSSLGGVESYTAPTHQWINSISSGTGAPSSTQPACGDISNAGTVCPTSPGTGLAIASTSLNSNAESTNHFSPGLVAAIVNTKGAFTKWVKASTVDNIEGSASTFTCTGNPTITLYECGTSATCATPTTIGSVTVTASGTVVDGTVSSAAIVAGDYTAWAISAGTCASLDIFGTAQVHSN
jgi:hypothetical protein